MTEHQRSENNLMQKQFHRFKTKTLFSSGWSKYPIKWWMISFLHSFGKFVFKNPKKISSWKNYPRSQDNKMGCSSCKCHTATVSRLLGVNFFYSCPDPFRFLRAGRLNVFRATDLWTQTWGTLSPNNVGTFLFREFLAPRWHYLCANVS